MDEVKSKAKATNVFHGKGFKMKLALILLCLEDKALCGKNPLYFIASIKWLHRAKEFFS